MGQPRFHLKLIGLVADIAQLDQQNARHKALESAIALDNRQWLFSIGFEIIHVVNDF